MTKASESDGELKLQLMMIIMIMIISNFNSMTLKALNKVQECSTNRSLVINIQFGIGKLP